MKCECHVFSGYKQRNKVCLVNLEWKLQDERYGWHILQIPEKATNKISRDNKTTTKNVPLMFFHVKDLNRKVANVLLGPANKKRKESTVYVLSV